MNEESPVSWGEIREAGLFCGAVGFGNLGKGGWRRRAGVTPGDCLPELWAVWEVRGVFGWKGLLAGGSGGRGQVGGGFGWFGRRSQAWEGVRRVR